jgi:hypothetical protein
MIFVRGASCFHIPWTGILREESVGYGAGAPAFCPISAASGHATGHWPFEIGPAPAPAVPLIAASCSIYSPCRLADMGRTAGLSAVAVLLPISFAGGLQPRTGGRRGEPGPHGPSCLAWRWRRHLVWSRAACRPVHGRGSRACLHAGRVCCGAGALFNSSRETGQQSCRARVDSRHPYRRASC